VGVPGHIAGPKHSDKRGDDLEHGRLPDPVLRTLSEVLDRQDTSPGKIRPRPSIRTRADASLTTWCWLTIAEHQHQDWQP
jgi:hypothetical protein